MPTPWTIWKKWVKFLVTYNLPKLNQEKTKKFDKTAYYQ